MARPQTLWPWLLRFPRNTVAVVDAFCMAHRGRAGRAAAEAGTSGKAAGTSNYAAADVTSTHEVCAGVGQGFRVAALLLNWCCLHVVHIVRGDCLQVPLPGLPAEPALFASPRTPVLQPGMEQGVVLGEWNFTAASLVSLGAPANFFC